MNFIFKVEDRVRLKKTIHYERLNKGLIGTVIRYEDYSLNDKFRNKPLDRIECVVLFRKYDEKAKKNIGIEEPFTEAEAVLYLEKYDKDSDEFFTEEK